MQTGEIIIYQAQDGETTIDVKLENDTIWLRQEQIAQLFNRDRTVVTKHINNIFKEEELDQKSNVQILHIANFLTDLSFSITLKYLFPLVTVSNRLNASNFALRSIRC